MSDFTLLIKSSPHGSNNHQPAIDFAHALIASDSHRLKRVFLYQDAVFAALNSQQPVQGQISITQQWQEIAQLAGIHIEVCIANALRRGAADQAEQQRYQLPAATLADHFELTGLGSVAEACSDSDRLIEF